jgi:hypothetical protein
MQGCCVSQRHTLSMTIMVLAVLLRSVRSDTTRVALELSRQTCRDHNAYATKQKTLRHMQYSKMQQRVSLRLLAPSCSVGPSSLSPFTNEYRSGSELNEQTSSSEINWALLSSILPRDSSHQAVQLQR